MLILLPFPDMEKAAKCFTDKHLLEVTESCFELLKVLKTYSERSLLQKGTIHNSFYNDVDLYKNHQDHLKLYCNVLYFEVHSRKLSHRFSYPPQFNLVCTIPWFWCEKYHRSHQAFLMRQDYNHYNSFNIYNYLDFELYWPNRPPH